MPATKVKDRLIEEIEDLPDKKIKEVIDFIGFLKLKEDDWFIEYVNRRSKLAEDERKSGKKFTKLEELQEEYR